MVDVDVKAIVSRLNPSCTRALERAAGLSVSRQHHEITVEHMLASLIEDPYTDVQSITKHFGIDPGRLTKALNGALDQLQSGNTGRPVFSPTLLHWFRDAWLLGSLAHRDQKIRSGHLIHAMIDGGMRICGGDYATLLEAINKRELAESLDNITADSSEQAEMAQAATAGGAPATAAAAPRGSGAMEVKSGGGHGVSGFGGGDGSEFAERQLVLPTFFYFLFLFGLLISYFSPFIFGTIKFRYQHQNLDSPSFLDFPTLMKVLIFRFRVESRQQATNNIDFPPWMFEPL